jgi:hypothetical protein
VPGARGALNVLNISLQICENHKKFQKCFSKMSFFGFKVQIFFKNGILGVHFTKILSLLKLKGRTLATLGLVKVRLG